VHIGLEAKEIALDQRPPSNLGFLVNVPGSMAMPDSLPLVKSALCLLVEQLDEDDRVAIVVYAGNSRLVLPRTTGDRREFIELARKARGFREPAGS
jgi:Ca-activated chloride channel family protein